MGEAKPPKKMTAALQSTWRVRKAWDEDGWEIYPDYKTKLGDPCEVARTTDAHKAPRWVAELIADAGNTYNTTGLTPSQLVEQRDQLVERVKEMEEELQAVKHNQSASVAPIAYVDGDDAMRRILWEPTQAAFDIPIGTKLYTQPTPADAEDAARYRWLRRWKGQEHEPPFTVQHEIDGTLWGGDLDAAIDAALSKARPNTAEGAWQLASDDEMFEFWWADHMPKATQSEAWAEWCALRSDKPESSP